MKCHLFSQRDIRMKHLVLTVGFLLTTTTVLVAQTADLVFTNGSVVTMNKTAPSAEAVAIVGNEITYVGDAAGAEALIGAATEVIDLAGKALLPGFVSAHDHVVSSNWTKAGVNLNAAKSKEETFAMLQAYVDENPDLETILGQGYNANIMGGYPTAAELDAIVGDRIAFIIDYTIHDAWLSTKAMEAGGITKDTPDAVPGVTYWIRDESGTPTGVGVELAWFGAYAEVMWQPETMINESRATLQAKASKLGMTTVLVPGQVTPNFSNTDGMFDDLEAAMQLLAELDASGDLPMRTFMQPAYKDANADPVEFAERTAKMQAMYSGEDFGVRGIKIHPEGTWSSGGVLMVEPWADRDGSGFSATSPERIKEVILAANAKGLDVFTHAEGSGTVRGVIDAILASREAGNTDERNGLHHYMIVHPDDHQRVLDNKIPVNATPIFSTDWSDQDKDYVRMLGEARVRAQVGLYTSVANAGGSLSISADVPSSPIENSGGLINMYTAMTLKNPEAPETSISFPPDAPMLDLQSALEAVTINPAWQIRMEDKIGSIEVGKLADLVVLDKSPLVIEDPEDLLEIEVLGTVMDGKFRHRDGI